MNKPTLLGVLGGLGPMSTFHFCQMITSHTRAVRDADHIDMIISSRATTPDRTAFIVGTGTEDPLPVMQEEAMRLENAGAQLLVIPCNTAHYFYDGLKKACTVPILNIMQESVSHFQGSGVKTFGLLATEGTVLSGAYHAIAEKAGISCLTPSKEEQAAVSQLIYGSIKQNKMADASTLVQIAEQLQKRGAEKILLGCTELSLIKDQLLPSEIYIDSLEILAYKTILACGKKPVGFSHMR